MDKTLTNFSDISIDGFFGKAEIGYCLEAVEDRIANHKTEKTYSHKEDLEECILHSFDHSKLVNTLSSLTPYKFQPYTLYRIISNRANNYMITVFYNDITSVSHTSVTLPDIDENVAEMRENARGYLFRPEVTKIALPLLSKASIRQKYRDKQCGGNVSKAQHIPEYMELWYIKGRDKRVKSLYIVKCVVNEAIKPKELQSLHDDFERYLHRYIKPMSVFDIVGPSMVGPSSSHTAGANKIGQIARNIILAKSRFEKTPVKSVGVKLLSSFRDTGPGHYTPSAIGGGLFGLAPDHPQMLQHGDPSYINVHGVDFGDFTARFSGYIKGSVDEEQKYKPENNNNIAEIIVETEAETYTITGFSIGGGNVEVRYLNQRLSTPLSGKEDFYYHSGKILKFSEARGLTGAELIPAIVAVSSTANPKYLMPFNSFEENRYVKREHKSLIEVVLEVERNLQGTSTEEIMLKVAEYWRVMKASVKRYKSKSYRC